MEETYTIHKLKTWPVFFEAIMDGTKTFEVRYNDRRFKVGDRLDLLEFDPDAMENGEYTGRHCHRFISYILDANPFVDLQGYAILGLQPQEQSCESCGNQKEMCICEPATAKAEQETNEQPKRVSAEEIRKIETALALLNAMVLCGETHSDQSTKVLYEATRALSHLYSQEHPIEQEKPSDSDIENASLDYVQEMSFAELATISARSAYKQGAFDMRDRQIYISPKDDTTHPLIPSPQHQINEAMKYNQDIIGFDVLKRNSDIAAKDTIETVKKSMEKPSEQSAGDKNLKSILIDLEIGTIDKYAAYDLINTLYASQKHPVTDDMISSKLDTVNFETSKERETAFDLLVWMRDKIK